MHNKLQVAKAVTDFLQMVKIQFNRDVKTVRSDNGTELIKEH